MERGRTGPERIVGRYAIYDAIATGGMATVHIGRLIGPIGFSRTVAIKRLHPQFAKDPEFAVMLLDEAMVASRIRHPNVVPVIDVVADDDELLLVMEYVHGESLSVLLRAHAERSPDRARIVANIIAGALHGLHAAHETTGEGNKPLGIVHRDVTPQNVLLGVDGIPRVLDFGVAKAAGQAHCTGAGRVKGKMRYIAPEQITRRGIDRRSDVWSASVLLWESLTGRRLFDGGNDIEVMKSILERPISPPREIAPDVPEALSVATMRGLARDPEQRFATAVEMASALEQAVGLVGPREIGEWVDRAVHGRLAARRRRLQEIEEGALTPEPPPSSGGVTVTGAAIQLPPSEPLEPRRRRAWLVPSAVGAVVAVTVTAAFAVYRSAPSHEPTPVAVVVSAPPPSGAEPPSTLATSAPATSAPVVSDAAPTAAPSASSVVAGSPTRVQRGARRTGRAGRPPPAAGPRPDYRVPLYGRD